MASLSLPVPGSQYGPCVEPCDHTDCAATRADAAKECQHCHKLIGYDVDFYYLTDDGPASKRTMVHGRCHRLAIAKERATA